MHTEERGYGWKWFCTCNEMRPLKTYLCIRSTTESASVIAAIELAMIALWWTEGGGTIDDLFTVDPFALKYDPNLASDRGERAYRT